MKKFANLSQEKPWNLQLFAEGEGDGGKGGADDGKDGGDGGTDPKTFTQEQVDELLKKAGDDFDKKFAQKFAEMQKKHQKEIDEAKKLEQMSAEEKAQKEMEDLKSQIEALKTSNAKAEMMKSARSILSDKNITIGDDLLGTLVTTEAESTKKNVEEFATAFSAAGKDAVKKAMAGKTPEGSRDGSNNNTITKEEILKVQDQRERQRLMAEHLDLFR